MVGQKRVMVVDDEPRICQLLKIKLGISGYEVITVTNGADAIELARTANPDVILLDIVMPDISGMDILDRVRKFSHAPIIVFTGRPEIARIASQFGADDYIAKPFDMNLLMEKINQALHVKLISKKK
jgi:two-component system KDP operon response regulator KdpE